MWFFGAFVGAHLSGRFCRGAFDGAHLSEALLTGHRSYTHNYIVLYCLRILASAYAVCLMIAFSSSNYGKGLVGSSPQVFSKQSFTLLFLSSSAVERTATKTGTRSTGQDLISFCVFQTAAARSRTVLELRSKTSTPRFCSL